jgi:hypothetical protein
MFSETVFGVGPSLKRIVLFATRQEPASLEEPQGRTARALRYKRAGWGGRPPRARAIGDSPALRDENVSDDAEAHLASQVGERGDEFALKPLRVEGAGAIPPFGMLVVT